MSAKDVESAFRPAFEEIQRRKQAASSLQYEEGVSFFQGDGSPSPPWDLPDQRHFLVTMGTQVLSPRPADPSLPLLRVYGAFHTKEEAVDHSLSVREVDKTCSLVCVKAKEWILLPSTEAQRDDPSENERVLSRRMEEVIRVEKEREEEFNSMVREKRAPPPSEAKGGEGREEEEEMEEAERVVYPPPRRMRAGGEVRGQTCVALCVMRDESGKGECAFKLLACFDSHSSASTWVKNVASREVTDADILISATCEWISVNDDREGEGACTFYRNAELQRIMDAAKKNPGVVRDYKEWKRKQDEAKKKAREEAAVLSLQGALRKRMVN